jgi:hypothetical protein
MKQLRCTAIRDVHVAGQHGERVVAGPEQAGFEHARFVLLRMKGHPAVLVGDIALRPRIQKSINLAVGKPIQFNGVNHPDGHIL